MSHPLIIAIGRESGSGGLEIARTLAERFGLPLYDKNILQHAADAKGVTAASLEPYDECPRSLLFYRSIKGFSNAPEDGVAQMQFELLRRHAAAGESFVVLGRCAEEVLADCEGLVSIFIEADLDDMAAAYRMLGDILGRQEQAEELAQFIDRTVTMAQTNAAKIPESQRLKVLFGTGSTGLASNAAGSAQADVLDLVGAVNAIIPEEVTNRGGGTTVSLEEVYAVEPDVILLSSGGPYDTLTEGDWAGLTAVQQGRYYEIPGLPYDWMSSPPSVNRVLGIWWLGNLLYPELYDYDMVQVAQEYYRLFWHYDLTEEEARQMLSRSTLK